MLVDTELLGQVRLVRIHDPEECVLKRRVALPEHLVNLVALRLPLHPSFQQPRNGLRRE